MVLRGVLFRRCGPAECNLLPNPVLLNRVGEFYVQGTNVLVRSRGCSAVASTQPAYIVQLNPLSYRRDNRCLFTDPLPKGEGGCHVLSL